MGSRPARRHSRAVRQRQRNKAERKRLRLGERERWLVGERELRRSPVPRDWYSYGRLMAGSVLVGATGLFGVVSLAAPAAADTPCGPSAIATAVPGDSVAAFVYRWGLSWRDMADVWRVAQANPGMPDPNVLAVGERVASCGTPPGLAAHIAVSTHGLVAGETLAALEDPATGSWHWPLPVWALAQANPGIASPFAALPAGTVVHLLAGPPNPYPRLVAVVPPVSRPPATDPPARNFAPPAAPASPPTVLSRPPATQAPTFAPAAPAPQPAPAAPPRAPVPVAPVLPPATLPPDPPSIADPPVAETSPPPAPTSTTDPPAVITSSPTTSTTADPPHTSTPVPDTSTTAAPTMAPLQPAAPPAPPPVAALATLIHSGYAGQPDPADPAVVAQAFADLAKDDPGITPQGDATIIGGFIQESGLDSSTGQPGGRPGGDGGTAVGIAQWHQPRACGEAVGLDAQVACAANEIELRYPTVQGVLTDPHADKGALDHAEDTYEGEGKVGERRKYADGIAKAVTGHDR